MLAWLLLLLFLVRCASTQPITEPDVEPSLKEVGSGVEVVSDNRSDGATPEASPEKATLADASSESVVESASPDVSEPQDPPETSPTEQVVDAPQIVQHSVGLTYQKANGNRWVSGQGKVSSSQPVVASLKGPPAWVVSVPTPGGPLWAVALEEGTLQGFTLSGGTLTPTTLNVSTYPAGMPLALTATKGAVQVNPLLPNQSKGTHSVRLPNFQGFVYIDQQGDLVLWKDKELGRLKLNALPDARILVDERERLLLLTGATTRYGHNVLGDGIEAGSISLVETKPSFKVVQTIPIPAPTAVEGISPIWVDVDKNGTREILVTQSNASQGAQLVLYSESGSLLAKGPAIGLGNRWRHQLAVAPFGPGGEMEIVDVLTPHIGGPTEFFRWAGDKLTVAAEARGYTSHVIGSRNLDMGVAGDLDGDGAIELLIPSQDRRTLGAIRRSAQGASVVWTLDPKSQLTTNLSAVSSSQGLLVGAGFSDNTLKVWGVK
ncbi:MAG: hypothetical protein EP343_26440 [Deltaproteobacteria bacterium]|nr:MAG: hypothetical protein EP343_26440 [Deltaproteobacteria bacterium]